MSALKEGMRIKVVGGDFSEDGRNWVRWCAGKVPVGSTGTIIVKKDREKQPHFCIKWDNTRSIRNKDNKYNFGAFDTNGNLASCLELLA